MVVTFDGTTFNAVVHTAAQQAAAAGTAAANPTPLAVWLRDGLTASEADEYATRRRVVLSRFAAIGAPAPAEVLNSSTPEGLEDAIMGLPQEVQTIIRMNSDNFRAYMRAQTIPAPAAQVNGLVRAREVLAARTGRLVGPPGGPPAATTVAATTPPTGGAN